MDLEWTHIFLKFVKDLPEINIGRENLIAISGYGRRENANTNLLAFYFNENERHGFKRLFLNSLLDIYESKAKEEKHIFFKDEFETEYEVTTEVSTDERNRIDIVIKGKIEDDQKMPNWAIIIENKIDHFLDNPLGDYYNSIAADTK